MQNNTLIDYLKQLVAFEPTSSDQAAVLSLLEFCKTNVLSTGSFKDVTIHEHNGYYSLTASTQGTKRPRLLLASHVDVVPNVNGLSWNIRGDKVYGRGVYDMLFATASYLAFINQHKDRLSELDFGIMLTGDEEVGGYDGTDYLLKQGFGAELAIIPDAGNGYGDLSVGSKGVYNTTLVTEGKSHHGSRPWEGDNSVDKLIDMIVELRQSFDTSDRYNSTMTVARLLAGDADNQGPARSEARLDIRYKDETDLTRILDNIAALSKKYNAHVIDTITSDSYQLDADDSLIHEFIQFYEQQVGKEITRSRAYGSSDAPFFASQQIPTVLLRPFGSGAHGDDEWLSIPEFGKFHDFLTSYILQMAKIK